MAGIQKVKKGKYNGYRVRWRQLDGSEQSQYCTDRASAQRVKQEVEERLERELRQSDDEPVPGTPHLDIREILSGYLRESVRINRKGTAQGHARALDVFLRFLKEKHGKRNEVYPLTLLTRQLLATYYDWLAIGQHGKPRKLESRRRLVNVVEYAWAWAADDDEFVNAVPRPRRLRMPKDAGRPTVAPTWREMDSAIAAAKGWQKKVLVVLRFTGLRVQQVMGLLWDDVDMERMILTIRGELGKSQAERRGRIIPLSPHLVSELTSWGRREGFLIPSGRKAGPRQREARARDIRRAWSRANVRPDAWRQPHHSFRKGFISGLKRAGADSDAVEYLVGHSLGLRGVYTDPDALPLRAAVELIPPVSTPESEKSSTIDNSQ